MIGRPLSGRPLAGRPLGGRALAFGDGQNASGKGAGDIIRSIFADGTDGFYYNFSTLSKLWQDTAGSTPVAAAGDNIARAEDSSPRGRNATQATTAAQPKYQTGGLARFDGSDDNLLTTLVPANLITLGVKLLTAGIAGTKIALGSDGAGASTQAWIGQDTNLLRVAMGGAAVSGPNIAGVTGVAFVTADAVNVRLYWQGAQVAQTPRVNAIGTTYPFTLGSFNNSGGAANFLSCDVYHALVIKKALTAAEVAAITNLWGTA